MGILMKTDGTVTKVAPKNGKVFSLEELQGFVGGYIEMPNPPSLHGSEHPIMVANEEGHIHGLPFNKKASALFANQGLGIVGDVILISPEEAGEGEETEEE